MPAIKDMTGFRSGRLTVLGFSHIAPRGPYTAAMWTCRCDCANMATVMGHYLRGRTVKSCGCLRRDTAALMMSSHGFHSHALYSHWKGMMHRCYAPSNVRYQHYGGRGITVCEAWRNVGQFIRDMESSYAPGLTLHRRNNNGNYEPGNCMWANTETQANNTSRCHHFEYDGEILTPAQIGSYVNISSCVMNHRLHRAGWTVERAISTPVEYRKPYRFWKPRRNPSRRRL